MCCFRIFKSEAPVETKRQFSKHKSHIVTCRWAWALGQGPGGPWALGQDPGPFQGPFSGHGRPVSAMAVHGPPWPNMAGHCLAWPGVSHHSGRKLTFDCLAGLCVASGSVERDTVVVGCDWSSSSPPSQRLFFGFKIPLMTRKKCFPFCSLSSNCFSIQCSRASLAFYFISAVRRDFLDFERPFLLRVAISFAIDSLCHGAPYVFLTLVGYFSSALLQISWSLFAILSTLDGSGDHVSSDSFSNSFIALLLPSLSFMLIFLLILGIRGLE